MADQPTMNVKIIVRGYLVGRGFDGLVNTMDECGCENEDLMPCGSDVVPHCEPGHKSPCVPEECEAGGCDGLHMHKGPKP